MASIGPTLPPHLLAKRKRDDNDADSDHSDISRHSSDDTSNKKHKTIGPSLPDISSKPGSSTNDGGSSSGKKDHQPAGSIGALKLKAGPSLPPADLTSRPPIPEDEDSDDDFGPALPGSAPADTSRQHDAASTVSVADTKAKSGRDDWMLAPPSAGDWTSRIDPSKLKNRGFTSGKGSRSTGSTTNDLSLWTETPEEKRKRLEEEMLGVRKVDQPKVKDSESLRREAEAARTARKIEVYNEKNRAAPLYAAKQDDPDEDDPSKRAFDREKDIAGGKLSHAQKKDMMNKAADFGSRFSKGSYL